MAEVARGVPVEAGASESGAKQEDAVSDAGGPDMYKIKRMSFLNQEAVAVVLQNENGPCPLLALANALLLRGTLALSPERNEIGSEELIGLVADCILEKNPVDAGRRGSERTMTLEKTIDDVINLLPSLQYGLDVNVHFSGITDFEFDSRISVFDLLDVRLLHGWAVDPDDKAAYEVMQGLSYNQATDKLVGSEEAQAQEGGHGGSADAVAALQEAEVIRGFLSDTSSQFTFRGLTELHRVIKERELCAFFRNNHFATIFKMDGALYLLVTDQGYRHNGTVAWELLNDIGGDTDLRSPEFGNPNEYVGPEELLMMAAMGEEAAEANGLTPADLERGRKSRKSTKAKKAKSRSPSPTRPPRQATTATTATTATAASPEARGRSASTAQRQRQREGVQHTTDETPNADEMLARQMQDEEDGDERRRVVADARKKNGGGCLVC